MSYRHGEQGTDYGQSHKESYESAAHNNLPLCAGDDGVEYFGKGAKCGYVTYAMMLAFNCMQSDAGLGSLAFELLVRWNTRGETSDKIVVTFVLCTANKCRWRFQLC